MSTDSELEARLAKLRPAEPPAELLRRLRTAGLEFRAVGPRRREWRLAYAGLCALWLAIFALHALAASLVPASPEPFPAATAAGADFSHLSLLVRGNPGDYPP